MVCDRRKFPKAEMLPLTREEMISLLKGNGTPRVGVACGNWLHIDELALQDQKAGRRFAGTFSGGYAGVLFKKAKAVCGRWRSLYMV